MKIIYEKSITFDAETSGTKSVDLTNVIEKVPRLWGVNVSWSGLDNTDATVTVYGGAVYNNDNTKFQIGTTKTLDSANSNLDAEQYNYEGVLRCVDIVYSAGSNTTGDILITVVGLG